MKNPEDMTEKEWKNYSAVKLSEMQYDSLRMKGIPEAAARWRANEDLQERLAEINETTAEELRAEFDAEAEAAGLSQRIIPRDAYVYRSKGRETTFNVDGVPVDFAHFLLEASKCGYKEDVLEARIAAIPTAQRFSSPDVVTFTEDEEVKKDE